LTVFCIAQAGQAGQALTTVGVGIVIGRRRRSLLQQHIDGQFRPASLSTWFAPLSRRCMD
jgi:hypothetical protein